MKWIGIYSIREVQVLRAHAFKRVRINELHLVSLGSGLFNLLVRVFINIRYFISFDSPVGMSSTSLLHGDSLAISNFAMMSHLDLEHKIIHPLRLTWQHGVLDERYYLCYVTFEMCACLSCRIYGFIQEMSRNSCLFIYQQVASRKKKKCQAMCEFPRAMMLSSK